MPENDNIWVSNKKLYDELSSLRQDIHTDIESLRKAVPDRRELRLTVLIANSLFAAIVSAVTTQTRPDQVALALVERMF